mmetsp:Transcript_16911/g.59081  ORF Transcript_16911/g.59081 Transcript_16911/m.59081 type:complete len:216 (+) Transcript_16911:232-879(+)
MSKSNVPVSPAGMPPFDTTTSASAAQPHGGFEGTPTRPAPEGRGGKQRAGGQSAEPEADHCTSTGSSSKPPTLIVLGCMVQLAGFACTFTFSNTGWSKSTWFVGGPSDTTKPLYLQDWPPPPAPKPWTSIEFDFTGALSAFTEHVPDGLAPLPSKKELDRAKPGWLTIRSTVALADAALDCPASCSKDNEQESSPEAHSSSCMYSDSTATLPAAA